VKQCGSETQKSTRNRRNEREILLKDSGVEKGRKSKRTRERKREREREEPF